MELCAEVKKAIGQTYLLADNEALSVKDLGTKIAAIQGVSFPRYHVPIALMYPLCAGLEFGFKAVHREPLLSRRSLSFFINSTSFDTPKAMGKLL